MKPLVKKIIIRSILGVFLLGIPLFGFVLLKQTTKSNKYADWMSSLDDKTSLREVNMPGSHDTMALYSIGDLAGQCQSLSLKEQLNLGVRFLDIRLKEDNNKLKAVHGFIDQNASFKTITKTVESFINKHPQEFLIMSIKEEANASKSKISFEDNLKTYLNSDIYLKGNDIPEKVGDVRGKILLLSRYANSTIGIPAYSGWEDSATFALPNDIYVQDTYKITSALEKQTQIVRCFHESGHALKINFLSAYRTDTFPPSYAVSAAADINPWIDKEIINFHDRGIVLYDFVTESNMNHFFEGLL